ncbi:MAG: isochorismatase family protein [Pirellulaceae bacterium]|nr:isochorismatase family protein [Pirellulaceae bacterium]
MMPVSPSYSPTPPRIQPFNRSTSDSYTAYCSRVLILLAGIAAVLGAVTPSGLAEEPATSTGTYSIRLRAQSEVTPGSGRYHRTIKPETWSASDTAVIVCDMWDSHHCLNAVRRVGEVAPRMNALLVELRKHGATIIHAPSGCMEAYVDAPARVRAQKIKPAANVPSDISTWCDRIDSESSIPYPLDQSAGGEDDDLVEHAQWAATLKAAGRNPRAPWLKQTDMLTIDNGRDYISDSGTEIWSILEDRRIKHVALVGVHTNMCVLGRPFGLRQLASHGKQVALIRDMTDTMYDPRCWPYVSHFSGTDLIVDHIERHVCPSFTSADILGGQEFRFAGDLRPRLAILIAEDEYETEITLPEFVASHLGGYRVQLVFGDAQAQGVLPGIEQIASADALLVSMRRRPIQADQLAVVRQFVDAGKPVIGIRTASHAFCLRDKPPATGLAEWREFDGEVLGGSYTNHYGNNDHPQISVVQSPADTPLAQSLKGLSFVSTGSLYKVLPLGAGTQPLLMGAIANQKPEPVAWTNVRAGGGRTFYTSLGHKGDFAQDAFRLLLANGIHWACDQPLVTIESIKQQREHYHAGHGKQRK